jgi:hypothetical protein
VENLSESPFMVSWRCVKDTRAAGNFLIRCVLQFL